MNGDCTSRKNSLKIFFGLLVRIKLISGGVMICVDRHAVSTSPEESEGGGGGGMHTIRASTPMCKLLCEVAVLVDVGLVAKGRDPVDIGSTGSSKRAR